MTPKTKSVMGWIIAIGGSVGGLAVIGMAAQFWISVEVKAQLTDHTAVMVESIPDTDQITTDVAVIKSTVVAIEAKTDTAIENQRHFEEIFMDYLRNQAEN